MSPVREDHLLEFVENQDHAVVLAALQRFLDNPELLLLGLKVLLPLARPGKASVWVWLREAPPPLSGFVHAAFSRFRTDV